MTTFADGVFQYGGAPVGGVPGLSGSGMPMPPKSGKTLLVGTNQRYPTIASAVADATDGDVILLSPYQDYDEYGISTPAGVDHVTIIGMGNAPRATRWRNSTNAASAFITVRGAGWVFQNIYFAGATAGYCIDFLRDATYNASEGRVLGCIFNGGSGHIVQTGGCANIVIAGNRFIGAVGGTAALPGCIIGASTAQAIPTNWEIFGNRFYNSARFIDCSMSRSMVYSNIFQTVGHDTTASSVIALVGTNGSAGVSNMVTHNVLGRAAADVTIANGFAAGTGSVWTQNFADDAEDYGLPA